MRIKSGWFDPVTNLLYHKSGRVWIALTFIGALADLLFKFFKGPVIS